MASIGQPIDRVDGRLKVTGRAKYAAEFAVPGVVHAVLVQSTIGAGAITELRPRRRPGDAGRARRSSRRTDAPKLPLKGGAQQMVRAPLLQDMNILFNGQHVAVVVADTLEQANDAASRVRVQYRRDEPITSMDAVLDQAYTPKNFRNGERPAGQSRAAIPTCSFSAGAAQGRCHLRHADGASQSDGAARDDRAVGRRSADRVDGDAGHLRRADDAGGTVRHRPEECAGDLSLCRRWLRLQGQYLAAGDARRDGGKGRRQAGSKLVVTRAQMFTSNGYRPRTVQKLRFAADDRGASGGDAA